MPYDLPYGGLRTEQSPKLLEQGSGVGLPEVVGWGGVEKVLTRSARVRQISSGDALTVW